MERLLIAVVLVAVVAVVAVVISRRRPDPPSQQGGWPVPTQLDRRDFDQPDVPWLVAVFTSSTCDSCSKAVSRAQPLASTEVAVVDVSYQSRKDLHERYGVEAVPCTVVVDAEGVVQRGFIGELSATDLWAAVAEAREPGSTPEPDLGAHRSPS